MVRYTPDHFLTEYTKFLTKVNSTKKGSVELSFKRYDATSEENLPPSNDKTGILKKKTKGIVKGASNPESGKKNGKNGKNGKNLNSQKKPTKSVINNNPEDNKSTILKEPSVLVRAKFGDKKVSCVVPTKDIASFDDQFGTLFRLHSRALVPEGQDSDRMKARKIASKKATQKK
jgi:hypothetical protein